jgi:hypothetical protein
MTLSKIRLAVAAGLAAAAVAVPGVGRLSLPTTHAAPPPTAASAPKDPLDRIKLVRLGNLLKVEGIQTDIALTDEQKAKVEEARKKQSYDTRAALQVPGVRAAAGPAGGGGVGGVISVSSGDFGAAIAEAQAAFDKTVLAALSEAQTKRLKQLFIQAQGVNGLLDRRVIRALELTADQEDEIEKAVPATTGGPRPDVDAAAKAFDAALTAGLKVLTPGQREKWTALVGRAAPAAILVQVNTGGSASFSVAGGGVMAAPAAPVPPPKK